MNHEVHIPSLGKATICGSDQSILDAFLREGVWLPHACTQGTCGTCKMRVLGGTVDHRASSEYTLTPSERADGIALGCQAAPRTGLELEPVNDLADDGVERHPLRDYTGTVTVLRDIARDIRLLIIELDEPIWFNAGQYADIVVPGAEVTRQYSMANSPGPDGRTQLEFHIKRTPGGIATDGWIFKSLREGDRIELTAPLGNFGVHGLTDQPSILIAGSTGLAPLQAIIQHAIADNLGGDLYLYHGVRNWVDLYNVDYFRNVDAEHARVHYRPCLSDEMWDGTMGMVTDAVLKDFPSCKGMTGYLCGPPAMVAAGYRALKRRRMAPRRIFSEEFLEATGN